MIRIIAWYLNPERIAQFIGTKKVLDIGTELKDFVGINCINSEISLARIAIKEALEEFLYENKIPTFYELAKRNDLKPGKIFTIYQDFYCKGLAKIQRIEDMPITHSAEIWQKIKILDNQTYKLRLQYSPRNLIARSAWIRLSGRSRLFCAGYIWDIKEKEILASPLIIGDPDSEVLGEYGLRLDIKSYGEIHPYSIDSFEKIQNWLKKK